MKTIYVYTCTHILFFYTNFRFDAPRIENLAKDLGLYERLSKLVYGYTDTLPLFKKKIPKQKSEKISYSVEALVKKFLPEEDVQKLHDALQDIKVLKKLVKKLGFSENNLKDHCQSTKNMKAKKTNKIIFNKHLASLQFLKDDIVITLNILKQAYKKDPKKGIKILVTMNVDKKARVAAKPEVINAINDKIKNVCTCNVK